MSRCRLGDHISIKHGFAFDGEFFSDVDNGVVLVTPGNFAIGGGYQEGKAKYFTGEYPEEFVLTADDLIVTMTDLSKRIDTLGYGALVPDDGRTYLHNQRIGLVQFKDDAIDKHYLSYLMRSYDYQRAIAGSSSGSTVHHSSPDKICAYEFNLPHKKAQRRIASVLMAYDNLIENNRRQIALLEEAAQRLYREWFVDLRFPGHEGVEIVDELPDGWLRMPVSEYAHVIKGCSYKTENIDVEQGVLMVNLASIASWGGYKPYTERVYDGAYKADQVLSADDVVMALTEQTAGLAGYVARIPRYAQGSIPSMDLACLRPKNGSRAYLYCTCRFGDVSRLLSPLANGTKIKHLKPEALGYTDMPVPPMTLQQRFEDTVNPTFECIDVLMEQNERLRAARDRLLPRLMSGEIEV